MELKQGMYVRTKDGELHKCLNIYIDENNPSLNRFKNEWSNTIMFDEIDGEPSFDIAELIEIGDYVNGKPVECVTYSKDYTTDESYLDIELFGGEHIHNFEDIKSVVTIEQFKSAAYEVNHESTN